MEPDMFGIELNSLDDTIEFGRMLGKAALRHGIRAICMTGGLGSGKTTLTNALVRSLPGSENAEPASPSFSICNRYPTIPPVVHCDLYRCGRNIPDEVLDALDEPSCLTIIEWAEFLPALAKPKDTLDIILKTCDKKRLLELNGDDIRVSALIADLRRGPLTGLSRQIV